MPQIIHVEREKITSNDKLIKWNKNNSKMQVKSYEPKVVSPLNESRMTFEKFINVFIIYYILCAYRHTHTLTKPCIRSLSGHLNWNPTHILYTRVRISQCACPWSVYAVAKIQWLKKVHKGSCWVFFDENHDVDLFYAAEDKAANRKTSHYISFYMWSTFLSM